MIRNWNLIHTLPARSVQLLLRYVVILCQFQFQFQFGSHSVLFPKKKRSKLKTQLLADCRLNYPGHDSSWPDWIFHATAHAHRFTSRSLDKARLGLLTEPTGWKWSPQRICLPQMPSHTHTMPKKKRKASEKEPEDYRKSCTIVIIIIDGRSLIWPDKNTYTNTHPVYCILDPCIVSLGRRLSHSHFGQVFDSLFLSQIKWHAYYFYGYTVANRCRCSTVTYPAHRLLTSLSYMTRSNCLEDHISHISSSYSPFALFKILQGIKSAWNRQKHNI